MLYRMVMLPMTFEWPLTPQTSKFYFLHFSSPFISSLWVNVDTSNFAQWFAMWWLIIGITNCPLSGRSHGHVTSLNFGKYHAIISRKRCKIERHRPRYSDNGHLRSRNELHRNVNCRRPVASDDDWRDDEMVAGKSDECLRWSCLSGDSTRHVDAGPRWLGRDFIRLCADSEQRRRSQCAAARSPIRSRPTGTSSSACRIVSAAGFSRPFGRTRPGECRFVGSVDRRSRCSAT